MAIDVRVFPNSGISPSNADNTVDRGASLITEYNIASLINTLIDKKGFVISSTISNNQATVEFNLQGYYFKTIFTIPNLGSSQYGNFVKITRTTTTTINATIWIKNYASEDVASYRQLEALNGADGSGTAFTLTLLTLTNGSWSVPLESRIHFKTYLDDGDLDN